MGIKREEKKAICQHNTGGMYRTINLYDEPIQEIARWIGLTYLIAPRTTTAGMDGIETLEFFSCNTARWSVGHCTPSKTLYFSPFFLRGSYEI